MRDESISQLKCCRQIPFAQELRSHNSCANPQQLCQPLEPSQMLPADGVYGRLWILRSYSEVDF